MSYPLTPRTACGLRDCSFSIHDGQYLTFGRGNRVRGHWEYPCAACARAYDESREEVLDQTRKTLLHNGSDPASVEQYLSQTPWLHHEAWPFAQQTDESAGEFIESNEELLLAAAG